MILIQSDKLLSKLKYHLIFSRTSAPELNENMFEDRSEL